MKSGDQAPQKSRITSELRFWSLVVGAASAAIVTEPEIASRLKRNAAQPFLQITALAAIA
jgi:hypothetical protein